MIRTYSRTPMRERLVGQRSFRRRPHFEDHTLTGLQPRDRFTLWVVMKPAGPMPPGRCAITFLDTTSEKPVLTIPVFFGDADQGGHHEH